MKKSIISIIFLSVVQVARPVEDSNLAQGWGEYFGKAAQFTYDVAGTALRTGIDATKSVFIQPQAPEVKNVPVSVIKPEVIPLPAVLKTSVTLPQNSPPQTPPPSSSSSRLFGGGTKPASPPPVVPNVAPLVQDDSYVWRFMRWSLQTSWWLLRKSTNALGWSISEVVAAAPSISEKLFKTPDRAATTVFVAFWSYVIADMWLFCSGVDGILDGRPYTYYPVSYIGGFRDYVQYDTVSDLNAVRPEQQQSFLGVPNYKFFSTITPKKRTWNYTLSDILQANGSDKDFKKSFLETAGKDLGSLNSYRAALVGAEQTWLVQAYRFLLNYTIYLPINFPGMVSKINGVVAKIDAKRSHLKTLIMALG